MNAAVPLSTKIAQSTLEQVEREFASRDAVPVGEDENLERIGALLIAVCDLAFSAEAAKDFVLKSFSGGADYCDVMRRDGLELIAHLRDVKTNLIALGGVINGKVEG